MICDKLKSETTTSKKEVDAGVKHQRKGDPHRAPGERFLHLDFVRLLVKDAQVKGEHEPNKGQKRRPNAN